MEISKLILMSVAVGCFGMYATTASSESATSWGNASPNSRWLDTKINLGPWCIKPKSIPKSIFIKLPKNTGIIDFGAALAPLTFPGNRTTVAVHIIPYVISERDKARLYLIYKRNYFYRACREGYNQRLARQHLGLYPLILLHVAKENRAELVTYLRKVRWMGFLRSQIDVKLVKTVGDLLEKVFTLKQAEFLKGLPFNVCVELIDERKKPTVKFVVQNVTGSAPSPCWRKPQQTSPTHHSPSTAKTSQQGRDSEGTSKKTEEVKQLQTQFKELQEQIAKLTDEKHDMAKQLETVSSKLAELKNKLADSNQQQESNSDNELDKEVTQLRKELEEVQAKLAVNLSAQRQSATANDSDDQNNATTNHRLIVVSLSAKLKEQAKVIRESLNEVFSNLKRAKSETPFTLITIQTGRRLYTLLNDKEMPNLPSSGDSSIQGQLERSMQFGATDLRALDDLGLVDTFIQYQEDSAIERVLYFTDNARMSDNPKEISRKQRGIPLAWHTDGIDLTVLTTEKCQVWTDVKAKCISWQGKTELKRQLNTYFK